MGEKLKVTKIPPHTSLLSLAGRERRTLNRLKVGSRETRKV
jgi:hypothetical protein